jgi:hypothetical protein
MVEIDGKLLSLDIFEKHFVCDLKACKGNCCVAGDAGAPLTAEEVDILNDELENIKPFMLKAGIAAIAQTGVSYMSEGEAVTTLVDNSACAFVVYDAQKTALCAIEQAHRAGKTHFKKPISCHLYPIRTRKLASYTALNYDRWEICKAACTLGDALKVKIYQFLKEPLIRAFGKSFYDKIEAADALLDKK